MKKIFVSIVILIMFYPGIVFAQKDRPTALVKSVNGNIEEVLIKPFFRPVRPTAEISDWMLGTKLVLISPPVADTEVVTNTRVTDFQLAEKAR